MRYGQYEILSLQPASPPPSNRSITRRRCDKETPSSSPDELPVPPWAPSPPPTFRRRPRRTAV
jgi:hypothetical protein